MRTVIIWDQCGEALLSWFVVDGDYSELNGVYVNEYGVNEKKEEKLNRLCWPDEDGFAFDRSEDFNAMPRDDVKIIVCGIVP